METTRVDLDVYRDEAGNLYQRVKASEGSKNPKATRSFFGEGDKQTVRWLIPLGTISGSKAESDAFDKRSASMTAGATPDAKATK